MQTLDLTFSFANGDTINVDVEPDTILEDAWRQMVEAEAIKPLPHDKTLVISNAEGTPLNVRETVGALGVQSGDTLNIFYEGKA